MPPSTPGIPNIPSTSNTQSSHKNIPKGSKWDGLRTRANVIGSIITLFVFLIGLGIVTGYYYSQSKKVQPAAKAPIVQTLTPSEINQLGSIGSNLGTTNQVLNIGADALFRGKANVTGDLTVGGKLTANGPATLSQLDITGAAATAGLSVGSNLGVSGTTTLQKALTVNALTTINSGLTVSGQVSAASVSAGAITVNSITITGPLSIGHLVTTGPTPFYASGADGSGGTVSISGNDTSGTININTGTGPVADAVLMTITFRGSYGTSPHVQLTARTTGAAQAEAYVIPTSTGFQVLAHTPPSGHPLSFDYLVSQ
jgi:hypothetical protein